MPAEMRDSPHRVLLSRMQWWLTLGALEFFAISVWLDTDRIAATGVWRLALKRLPTGILFSVLAMGLAALLGGLSAWTKIKTETDRRRLSAGFPWSLYGLHLIGLVGFTLCAWFTIADTADSGRGTEDVGLTIACLAFGLSACFTWIAGLLPYPLWKTALPFCRRGLVLAVPITIAAWAVSRVTRDSWRTMAEPTLDGVLFVLHILGERPHHPPDSVQVSLGQFSVVIHPECSGYQGFGVMAVFASIYVWMMSRQLRFPQAWLLVPLALAASWCGNVLRIATLLAVGAHVSPEIALGGFHSQAGWSFLIVVSVLFVGVTQRLPFFNRDVRRTIDLQASAAAACLVPFLLWNTVGLISMLTAADPAVDPLYPARWLILMIPIWYWRGWYARLLAVNVGSLLGVLTGGVAFAVWMLLEQWIPTAAAITESTAALLQGSSPTAKVWLGSRIIGSCLAIPFVEELAFRGYLMRRLQSFRFEDVPFPKTTWAGLLISSIAFGALHGDRWLAGVLVGLIFGLTVRLTGRLSAGVVSHATTNALLTAYVLATGDYARWH